MADEEQNKPGEMSDDKQETQKPGEMSGEKPKLEKPEGEMSDGDKAELERTREALKKANKEAEKYRKTAESYEQEKKAAEEKALADQGQFKELADKREKEILDLKDKLQKQTLHSVVIMEAAKAGIVDPEDAVKLADFSKVQVGEDGISGVAEAISALIAAKPYLVKQATSSAPAESTSPKVGATNPGGGPQMTAADFRKLTPQQIAAMKPEEVAAILAAQK